LDSFFRFGQCQKESVFPPVSGSGYPQVKAEVQAFLEEKKASMPPVAVKCTIVRARAPENLKLAGN
jgi:hypothetical protein